MFDDTSPKLELKGASEDLTKETNILARGFQMNATLGKITEIGLGKITEIVFLPLILPMQPRMTLCIYAKNIDKMNLINFFRLNKISYYKFRIHFMFDDKSPKLELQGASEDLTKETNILARGFQMNATLGKITEIGNEKV